MDLNLTENFNSPVGEFLNYDAYQLDQRTLLDNQSHADIRNMGQTDITGSPTVGDLSFDTLDSLAGEPVGALGAHIIFAGENWNATVAPDATRANMPVLSRVYASGETFTIRSTTIAPIDISAFSSDGFLSMTLPDFPYTSIDFNNSGVNLWDSHGNNNGSPLDFFLQSNVNGNNEFRAPLNPMIPNVDLNSIIKIELVIKTTAICTIKIMAVRAVSPNWKFASVDMDTIYGRLKRTVPIAGDITQTPATQWPISWRSQQPSGVFDPRPINSEVGVIFNTGSKSVVNQFTIYFRELTEDFLTQIDLDSLHQGELDGHVQPDIGISQYDPRIQSDLDVFDQDDLDLEDQFELERAPDALSALWVQFTCQWSPSTGIISILNTTGLGYTFTLPSLTANTSYVMFASLDDTAARVRIFNITLAGNIGSLVFDSTSLNDDFAFKRRAGRFGWFADLRDGDAWIDTIQERSAVYAEYKSAPLTSNTPVEGARLYASTSPNIEFFEFFVPGPFTNNNDISLIVSRDASKSTTGGQSYKVSNLGSGTAQGIISNVFALTDFDNSEIKFDVYYPSNSINAGINLKASLIDEDRIRTAELVLPTLSPDQWQTVKITLPFEQTLLTGDYQLFLYQAEIGASTWWVDNINIFSRSVAWDGRAIDDDPWHSNDALWTPFKDEVSNNNGILFDRRGTQLQVRGRALRPSSSIARVQILPKYAELGRFVTPDNSSDNFIPNPTIGSNAIGSHTIQYTAGGTITVINPAGTLSSVYFSNFEWNFGDGNTGIGPYVSHTYAAGGTYPVTLIGTDFYGNQGIATATVGA